MPTPKYAPEMELKMINRRMREIAFLRMVIILATSFSGVASIAFAGWAVIGLDERAFFYSVLFFCFFWALYFTARFWWDSAVEEQDFISQLKYNLLRKKV